MNRIHTLEWEDLQWFPQSWRDYGTDFLHFIATRFEMYKPVLPLITRVLKKSGQQDWVDCASGGGGGLIHLAKALKKEIPYLKIILTDLYPNLLAFERAQKAVPGVFVYEPGPVDATKLTLHFNGKLITIFGAFHHFRPEQAQKILQNGIDHQSPIAIFEPIGRNAASFFAMLFVPLNVLIFTLFIRPIRWQVLPFIYLLPIIPLYILWDGVASILRTYSEKELQQLVQSLHNSETYTWQIGRTKGSMPVYYLIGSKKVDYELD